MSFALASESASNGIIKGRFNYTMVNIHQYPVSRTHFTLYQIGNYSTNEPYFATTELKDNLGNFEFKNLPLNLGTNATTYFVMYPSSLDFNLKPNRILIEFTDRGNGTVESKAFKNYFGREFFPSKDITYPEKLESISMDPFIEIALVHIAPRRSYFQVRNAGILQSGIIGNILSSRWKTAAVITVICLAIFPFIVEKFDPETTKAMKEDALRKQREKYVIKN